jgi:hypothetical protein
MPFSDFLKVDLVVRHMSRFCNLEQRREALRKNDTGKGFGRLSEKRSITVHAIHKPLLKSDTLYSSLRDPMWHNNLLRGSIKRT